MLQRSISNFAVTGAVVTAFNASLAYLRGKYNGAADCYLQVHDSQTVVTGDGVTGPAPLWSSYVYKGVPFDWPFTPSSLEIKNGIYVCFSSTSEKKTIVTGGGNTGDIIAGVDEYELPLPDGTSTGSDLNTYLTVPWLDAAGPKKLYKATIVNNEATARTLMLFATDSPADGDWPIMSWALGVSATLNLNFGLSGYSPLQVGTDQVVHDACSLIISSTKPTLTAVAAASVSFTTSYL